MLAFSAGDGDTLRSNCTASPGVESREQAPAIVDHQTYRCRREAASAARTLTALKWNCFLLPAFMTYLYLIPSSWCARICCVAAVEIRMSS